MLKSALKAVLLIFILGTITNAQEITLKKSFWSDLQYSSDGKVFKNVRFNSEELIKLMENNNECLQEMKKYQKKKDFAMLIGISGGILAGYPIGVNLGGGGEWKDEFTTIMTVAATLIAVSYILDISAEKNVKNAVSIYNDKSTAFYENINLNIAFHQRTKAIGLNFNYSF